MSTVVLTVTTASTCDCCAPPAPCISGTFSCETRGGTATLCGFDELISPSVPPKKYLKCTFSGGINGDQWFGNASCPLPRDAFFTTSYTGDALYDPDTGCVLVSTGTLSVSQNGGAPVTTPLSTPFSGSTTCSYTAVTTTTSCSFTGTNTCCLQAAGGGIYEKVNGTVASTLSEEDTEDDAIARLFSGTPWAPCAGVNCCAAQWQERTSGFSFAYAEARWTIAATGLVPNATYSAIVKYWRRPYGVGPYTLYRTDTNTGTTDSSGDFSITGTVPNDKGYQTYAVQGTCPP